MTAGLICLANFPNPSPKYCPYFWQKKSLILAEVSHLSQPWEKKHEKKQIFQTKIVSYNYQM